MQKSSSSPQYVFMWKRGYKKSAHWTGIGTGLLEPSVAEGRTLHVQVEMCTYICFEYDYKNPSTCTICPKTCVFCWCTICSKKITNDGTNICPNFWMLNSDVIKAVTSIKESILDSITQKHDRYFWAWVSVAWYDTDPLDSLI